METKNLSSKEMDHLGLVAGMYDELGLGEEIDSAIKQDMNNREVSIGTICKALVMNGLGFTERRLYMVPSFFEGKPTEVLLGQGVQASHLNDSVVGRALDEIHAYGTTKLYAALVPLICERLELTGRYAHMDTTSFHLDGKYNSDEVVEDDAQVIHLTKGYSRDNRPDLNQVVLNLIVENQASIPLHMEVLDGNSSDKTIFQQTVADHISQLQNVQNFDYLVMDSSGYTKDTITGCSDNLKWISRVPASLNMCKEVINSTEELQFLNDKYQYLSFEKEYAGVRQRWLLVKSEEAFSREVKTLKKNWLKGVEKERKAWLSLCREEFLCEGDAQKAVLKFSKKCKYIIIEQSSIKQIPKHLSKGRPPKDKKPDYFHYRLEGSVTSSEERYKAQEATKGRFIIATNELDTDKLPDEELLKAYKGQSKVERGFRFLKDPQFVARNFFVKKPERLEALVFIMTLSLTVYAALEYRIRQQLDKQQQDIPNQLGKPTKKPTARWVFALFNNIQFLYGVENQPLCLNFNQIHLKITNLLGVQYKKYYLRI